MTRNSPRYPASISPGALRTPIWCLVASPDRGRTRPAYPSGRAIASPVPIVAPSLGASSALSTAVRSSPASPGYARLGSTAPGQAGTDEDAFRSVLALVDRRSQRVELRKLAAVLVGQKQPHELEPLGEVSGDRSTELVEALAGQR